MTSAASLDTKKKNGLEKSRPSSRFLQRIKASGTSLVAQENAMPKKAKPRRQIAAKRIGRARRIPDIKPGRYTDGLPLNEVQYLECKIILRPNHFTSRK